MTKRFAKMRQTVQQEMRHINSSRRRQMKRKRVGIIVRLYGSVSVTFNEEETV